MPTMTLGAQGHGKSLNKAAERGNAYHRKVYGLLQRHFALSNVNHTLLVEPWFRSHNFGGKKVMRQPDAVLMYPEDNTSIVIEVKMNWAKDRDDKLLHEYLPIVKTALKQDEVWPLMIVGNVRDYKGPLIHSLHKLDECLAWMPGDLPHMLLIP